MKYSKIKFLTFFAIICSIGLAPINDASANEGTAITKVESKEHDTLHGLFNSLVQVDSDTYALAYSGNNGDGYISTFTISADGSTITEIESLEHDAVQGEHNSLVQVDSDTYALAYAGTGERGFISTFDIDSTGDITPIKVANHVALGEGSSVNLEHDTAKGAYNSLVQVDSDTYALAYAGSGLDGYISTFTISSSGVITAVKTQSLTNNLEHDTAKGEFNSLVQVDSDTYALAYSSSGADGYISTFTISADGSTTLVEVESEEHDLAMGRSNSLVQVDSDTYALAYTGDANDGFISTFDINSAGNITPIKVQNHAVIGGTANLEHDTAKGAYNSLVQVDSDTYALAYAGSGLDGYISTFDISSSGAITAVKTQSLGNNLEHDTVQGEFNSLVQVDSDTYALAYTGDANVGYISTFNIAADGTTITEITSLEHDTDNGTYNSLVQVDSDTYALAYAGDSTDGYISTFTIDTFVATTTTKKSSSDCYDCKPPVLQSSHITILTNDYVMATGDSPLHITANVGDKVTILLNVTDNKFVDTIPFAALYTNFEQKPSDMNLYYANNYDNLKQVSTSFYEWNLRSDDVAYDYDGVISWSDNTPTIVTGEITDDNYFMINDNNVLEYFTMPFTFTINDSMDSTQIIVKVYDGAYNLLHIALPVVLDVAGNDPPSFDSNGKVLGFFNESVLNTMILELNGSEDTAPLSAFLGIPEESLPAWTLDLATWVTDEKIDSADMIVAVEYLINQ